MAQANVSLDEIIANRNIAYPNSISRARPIRSQGLRERKGFTNNAQRKTYFGLPNSVVKPDIVNTQRKMNPNARLTDAREILMEKVQNTDARLKLIAKRKLQTIALTTTKASNLSNRHEDEPDKRTQITITNPQATRTLKSLPIQGDLKITTVNEDIYKSSKKTNLNLKDIQVTTINQHVLKRKGQDKGGTNPFHPFSEITDDDDDNELKSLPIIPTKISKTIIQSNRESVSNLDEGRSPLQGTRLTVSNLHPVVTIEDIEELFGAVGALKRAKLIGPGQGEVVFVKYEDAVDAVRNYHNRELDGLPMQCKLDPSSSSIDIKGTSRMDFFGPVTTVKKSSTSIDPSVVTAALFKPPGSQKSTKPVVFTVKI